MTNKKKNSGKTTNTATPKAEIVTHPALDYSGKKDAQGNEPWRKWKVKPDLVAMPTFQPETGIGNRIAYCRGQLDNLSVEALARYIKNFDSDGISRTTIVRYESGENTPGARELRILCAAFWVPANWLLFGTLDSDIQRQPGRVLLEALSSYIKAAFPSEIPEGWENLLLQNDKYEIEKRQCWIDEARKPPPK